MCYQSEYRNTLIISTQRSYNNCLIIILIQVFSLPYKTKLVTEFSMDDCSNLIMLQVPLQATFKPVCTVIGTGILLFPFVIKKTFVV